MKHSPRRHTLAVLRLFLGKSQKEMGTLLGKSTPTIQAIELGKLNLSKRLAEEIARQTGISLKWLLDNKPEVPPVDDSDFSYTPAEFDRRQSLLKSPDERHELDQFFVRFNAWGVLRAFATTALASMRNGHFKLFAYKMGQAQEQLAKEFGEHDVSVASSLTTGRAVDAKLLKGIEADCTKLIGKLFREYDALLKSGSGIKPQGALRSRRLSAK